MQLMSLADGLITLRQAQPQAAGLPLAGTADAPLSSRPAGSTWWVLAHGQPAGRIGYETKRGWLQSGEVQLRCDLLPRDGDLALRAIQLVLHHLATRTSATTATLSVAPRQRRPRRDAHLAGLAAAAGFTFRADVPAGQLFTRLVPPLTYTDGVVTIRRQRVEDIDQHLAAIDDEQIDWLWEPGDRQKWEALTPAQQRARNLEGLRIRHDSFGTGPKWTFSADSADASYVAYVDCDLANNHVPPGEANIAYTAHPAHRGRGNVSRAVRLIMQFLRDHTGAHTAHIVVDARNTASLRVPSAVRAIESERWQDEHGRTMIRHVADLR